MSSKFKNLKLFPLVHQQLKIEAAKRDQKVAEYANWLLTRAMSEGRFVEGEPEQPFTDLDPDNGKEQLLIHPIEVNA